MNMPSIIQGCYVLLERLPENILDLLVNKPQDQKETATEEAPAAPDSTTSMFVEGEDVLVDRNHSGQFFMGTIVQIDRATEKCLLRFLDNKECWAHLNELQRVKDDPEEILCVICKKIEQNVVRCPKCGRGYHRTCLEQSIPEGVPASQWLCVRCGSKSLKRKRGRLSLSTTPSTTEQTSSIVIPFPDPKNAPVESCKNVGPNSKCAVLSVAPSTSTDLSQASLKTPPVRKFPYKLHSLVWDEGHRVNDTMQYCYCGKPGVWYMQMLQCAYCKQWFHQDCLSCLHFPIYCGDQLYLFLCSVCNDDEYIRRFDFGWVDIVHLAIFNLILFKNKKYFDVDSEIIPYVKNNWFYLQLPAQLVKCSDSELKRIILKMLEDNSTKNCRFKSGRAITSKKRIWGLRLRVPPKRIPFSLPPVRPLTDEAVRSWWKKCHITYREPLDAIYLMRGDLVLQPEGGICPFDYGLMLGQNSGLEQNVSRDMKTNAIGVDLLDPSIRRGRFINSLKAIGQSSDCYTGYAKKSSAYTAANRVTLQESLRRNRRVSRNRISPRSKALGKKDVSSGEHSDDVQENSSQDGYDSLDSQTSYSQDDNASSNAVSQDEESLDENDLSQDGYDSSEEDSDARSDMDDIQSVYDLQSVDDTQSVDEVQSIDSHDSFKKKEDIEKTQIESDQDLTQNKAYESQAVESVEQEQHVGYQLLVDTPPMSVAMGTPPVPSPTTDSILPSVSSTPADTEAEEELSGSLETSTASLPTIADLIGPPIVLQKEPVPSPALVIPAFTRLTPVINEPPQARAVKRKLSEKDIKIVNGEVKQRRRIRRVQSNQALGTRTVHLDSGLKLEKRIVGGKLLRSPLKPPIPETIPDVILPSESPAPSSSTSPFVCPEEMSVSDVKKNIKSIFNARNRIAAGEKFLIKGRRVTANGVEYLIQWEYPL